ncbi:MAG: BMP family ABC transporter substrate-binding protein [Oscillospiraceae bacterium]|nr:BMP family ABC transporter substrate-binding protein [Oscillospiraceae bacterium]
MKKILAMLLALVMVLGLVACGGDKPAETTAPKTDAPAESTPAESTPAESTPADPTPVAGDYKIAMITDYGDITDQSFNQTTYEACKAFAEENGVDFTYYKPAGDSTAERVAMVDKAVVDGYNIIVMPGFAFGEALVEVAPMYPDVKFVALDVAEGEGGFTATENVFSAVYQEQLSGYMAGYAAVKLGYKHLGYLGGMAVPAVQRFGYGYLQGIDAAAKELGIVGDIKVEYVYGNQFYGDADITAVMDTWYGEKGVEVVFACGGGIFTSAAEAAAKVEGAKVIGVDTDQAPVIDGLYGEGLTVTSALKGLAPTVKTVLSAIVLEDNWAAYAGKIESLGLVSADPEANYVQLPMESTQWSDTFTQEDYKALVAGMFDGTIAVSGDIAEFPVTEVAVEQHPAIKG